MGASERDALEQALRTAFRHHCDAQLALKLERMLDDVLALGREQGRQEERKAAEYVCLDCGRRITDGPFDLCQDCEDTSPELAKRTRGREGAGR